MSFQPALRVVAMTAGAYLLMAAAVWAMQRRMLYVPTCLSEQAALETAKRVGLQPWRKANGELLGWHIPSESTGRGSVLVVHGNGGCGVNRDYFARPIHEASGFGVYVLEYPGYGCRKGTASLRSLLAAAEEAIGALPSNSPVYVVGESLGTGVAAHLARTFPQTVRGLALFVPYDRLSSVAQHQMGWLPAGLLLRDRFAPGDWLKECRAPTYFVVAERDTIIPARFGLRLHDGYGGPKKLQLVQNAGHNDVSLQSAAWWKDVIRFWERQ